MSFSKQGCVGHRVKLGKNTPTIKDLKEKWGDTVFVIQSYVMYPGCVFPTYYLQDEAMTEEFQLNGEFLVDAEIDIDVLRYNAAVEALAAFTANGIIRNAVDNDEDPLTYSTDEEIVELYAKDLARDVAKRLPEIIKQTLTF